MSDYARKHADTAVTVQLFRLSGGLKASGENSYEGLESNEETTNE